jgi:Calcineurin-like phosphoesterase
MNFRQGTRPESTRTDPISNYKGRFALPNTNDEDYYSFDYADTHIIALPEIYVTLGQSSRFRTWLQADLSAARTNRRIHWIVAFSHRPFYSTGQRHGPYSPFDRNELPLLERYHVDLVISGHEHNYERSLPLQAGKVVSHNLRQYVQGRGTIFVVTGGGGANIYNDFGPRAPWDAVRAVRHEHVQMEVGIRTLSVVTISDFGKKLDAFTIGRL